MGAYRKICYVVEDVFVKLLSSKKDPVVTKQKVEDFRYERQRQKELKKQNKNRDKGTRSLR